MEVNCISDPWKDGLLTMGSVILALGSIKLALGSVMVLALSSVNFIRQCCDNNN